MVADGHVFVVRQQGIVGTKQAADVGGVVDGCVEIGVIADVGGQHHDRFRHGHEQRLDSGLMFATGAQEVDQAIPQRRPMISAKRHQ